MNSVEKLIASISPRWAYNRAAYRSALAVHAEALKYDAAVTGRRAGGWRSASTGPNSEIAAAGNYIRDRARDLSRNNPVAASIVRKLTAKTVGAGITPWLQTTTIGNPLRQKARGIWDAFVENCDPEGHHDFYGLQSLLARTVYESGEALVRLLPRPASWKMQVPLQLQILEGDWIDGSRDQALPDGGAIIQGVQYDAYGRRTGYWLFKQHPGDMLVYYKGGILSEFVPANQIYHVFEALRPGQARGVSLFAPVALKLKDLGDYDDAELLRAKIASCFAAFVTSPSGPAMGSLAKQASGGDKDSSPIERVRPATIQYLQNGQDVKFGTPPTSGSYIEITRAQLQIVAAGCGVTYSMATGDLSQVNFSSQRVGQNDFFDQLDAWQWLMFIPQAFNPIWNAVGRSAVAANLLSEKDPWKARWSPPVRRTASPKDDADTARENARSGFSPLVQQLAERGEDPEGAMEMIKYGNDLIDHFGLILDSDPRKVGRPSSSSAPSLEGAGQA